MNLDDLQLSDFDPMSQPNDGAHGTMDSNVLPNEDDANLDDDYGEDINDNDNNLEVTVLTILQDVFGVSQTTATQLFQVINQSGELDLVQQAIEDLKNFDDTLIPNDIDDLDFNDDGNENDNPNNQQFQKNKMYKKHDTDGWSPSQDRTNQKQERASLPPVSSPDDFPVNEDTIRSTSFLNYLNEYDARVDSAIMSMGDEMEQDIDPINMRRIEAMRKRGNTIGADKLKQQILRRIQPNKKPNTPAQSLVDQRKKQLVAAQQMLTKQTERTNANNNS